MRLHIRYLVLTYAFAIAIAVVALFHWMTLKHDYFEKRGVCFIPLMNSSVYNLGEALDLLYNSFPGEKICGYFALRDPVYIVRDPGLITQLSVDDFEYFSDHINIDLDVLLGNSMFFKRGEDWHDLRFSMKHKFHPGQLQAMADMIVGNAQTFIRYLIMWDKLGQRLDWELRDLFSHYMTDVLANTVFGLNIDSMTNRTNLLRTIGETFRNLGNSDSFLKLVLMMMFPQPMKALGFSFLDKDVMDRFKSLVLRQMNEREQMNNRRPDMIDLMLELKNQMSYEKSMNNSRTMPANINVNEKYSTRRRWSDDELIAQCLWFFPAAYAPMLHLLAHTSYELAINHDIQAKLHDEVLNVSQRLNGPTLDYESLTSMKYMDQVISEALRKWPPIAITDRQCVKKYELNVDGRLFIFEEDVGYMIPIYALHNDPKYFPNPQKFDPERFSEANKGNIVKGTYLPFGIGPRGCIGKHLASIEAKALLYYLVLNFRIVPNAATDIPLKQENTFSGILPLNGIHVDLKRRLH